MNMPFMVLTYEPGSYGLAAELSKLLPTVVTDHMAQMSGVKVTAEEVQFEPIARGVSSQEGHTHNLRLFLYVKTYMKSFTGRERELARRVFDDLRVTAVMERSQSSFGIDVEVRPGGWWGTGVK